MNPGFATGRALEPPVAIVHFYVDLRAVARALAAPDAAGYQSARPLRALPGSKRATTTSRCPRYCDSRLLSLRLQLRCIRERQVKENLPSIRG